MSVVTNRQLNHDRAILLSVWFLLGFAESRKIGSDSLAEVSAPRAHLRHDQQSCQTSQQEDGFHPSGCGHPSVVSAGFPLSDLGLIGLGFAAANAIPLGSLHFRCLYEALVNSGTPLSPLRASVTLCTDASIQGWRAYLYSDVATSCERWSPESALHFNV